MFIQKMIKQSMAFGQQVLWFTTLVSKVRNLPYLLKCLEQSNAMKVKTIDMSQGQKTSRIICWSFQSKNEQKAWTKKWQDKETVKAQEKNAAKGTETDKKTGKAEKPQVNEIEKKTEETIENIV